MCSNCVNRKWYRDAVVIIYDHCKSNYVYYIHVARRCMYSCMFIYIYPYTYTTKIQTKYCSSLDGLTGSIIHSAPSEMPKVSLLLVTNKYMYHQMECRSDGDSADWCYWYYVPYCLTKRADTIKIHVTVMYIVTFPHGKGDTTDHIMHVFLMKFKFTRIP